MFFFIATLLLEPNVLHIIVALVHKNVLLLFLLVVDFAMAYFVNLTKFLVTKHISALTLQVLHNAKGVLVVVISIVQIVGYSLKVFSVILYIEMK
jgi:hypothetical protein